MKKIWMASALALLLFMTPLVVHAEKYTGGDGWKVSFDGKRMTSTFKTKDIDDAVYKLEPGDSVDLTLALKNDGKKTTDWYMTNEVLKSLEDTQSVAEGGAYTYVLTYIDPEGNANILYSSEKVGGETRNESGEGLHQATNSLKDYFYLDQLKSGETGKITLRVELEGETQGNTYQDTLARLQMNFAVELTDSREQPSSPQNPGKPGSHTPKENTPDSPDTDTPGTDTPDTDMSSEETTKTGLVKTGDNSRILLYSVAALVAGLACVGVVVSNVRRNRKQEENMAHRKENE